jgi:hypothetical protein
MGSVAIQSRPYGLNLPPARADNSRMRPALICAFGLLSLLVGGATVAVLAVALTPAGSFVYHVLRKPPTDPLLGGATPRP